jgi:glycosyltransferase involved in cell wall biosynthesis
MRILITNHWLKKWGGSETFTYTLVGEAVKQGHQVDLFTTQKGLVSDKIFDDFGVACKLEMEYDLILANHHTTVKAIRDFGVKGKIIQTCHGTIPKLEQPSPLADAYVSISEEVKQYLEDKGINSTLILNGIDCTRFKPKTDLNIKPKRILSMVFSDEANAVIKKACNYLGIKLISFNKHKNPIFNIENEMNKADIIIGLGRCVYEAMACGRPIIIYDNRPYMPSYADGYLTRDVLAESIKFNCSGRRFKKELSAEGLIEEIKKYDIREGYYLKNFAKDELNMAKQFVKYLDLI